MLATEESNEYTVILKMKMKREDNFDGFYNDEAYMEYQQQSKQYLHQEKLQRI